MSSDVKIDVNGVEITYSPRRDRTVRARAALACAAALLALAALLLPLPARAGIIEDAIAGIGDFFVEGLSGFCSTLLNDAAEGFETIGANTLFTEPFQTILGSGGASLFTLAQGVAQYTVFPVACTLFGLAILLQLFKVAQRIEGSGTLPGVKDVVFLFVWVAIGMWVLGHSFALVAGVYDLVTSFCAALAPGDAPSLVFTVDPEGLDFGTVLGIALTCIFIDVLGLIVAAAAQFMFLARGVQIYLYGIFSPLMLSFLPFDELRPWALGFIRGFIAVCVSGFVMIFAVTAFPYLLSGLLSGTATVTADAIEVTVGAGVSATWAIDLVAASVALLLLLIKSGTYAREIIGG